MDIKHKMGATAAGLLVAVALALPTFAIADSASVTVNFKISPTVSAEVVDGGLLIRSNAPWQLVAEVADEDGSVVTLREGGPATGSAGALVAADDLIDYALVLDTAR